MSEQRIYNLSLLDSQIEEIEEIYPSSHGQYTISLNSHGSLWLLNPLSHASIELPFPLPISEGIEEVWDVWIFGSDPALVMVLYSTRKMFFCQPGKVSWKKMDVPSWKEMDVPSSYPLFNFTYHNGNFFFLNASNGATLVLNMNTLQKIGQIPPPVAYFSPLVRHLVELPTGELLLVLLDENCSDSSELERFRLYLLDEQQLQWSKVSSIGDTVLFVDCDRAMAFTAGDFSGCRGNCIYFVNYIAGDYDKNKMVLLFDIGKSQVDHVPISLDICESELRGAVWFVPTP